MTLEEMLRGGPLRQQRMAEDNAMNLAGMLARGRAGTVRQEPSLMQNIGGAITDYAVPDRYLPSSVMEPRLDMNQLESLRGTPVDMADVPDPVPMLMDTMPMAGITAWHGSPHKFSKFDMSKIGTGEGVQAYGHGLYMAENPKVAKEYADVLGRKNTSFGGKEPDWDSPEDVASAWKHYIGSRDGAISYFENFPKSSETPVTKKALEILKSEQPLKKLDEGVGNLYKVDIPDDQIAKMLDWDKPLSEQGEGALKLADKYSVSHNADGGTLLELMSANLRSKALASDEIKELGFPGIKYLDGGSRTGGKGTSNFVLFADDIAKILERNDQPIGELAEGLKAGSKLPMDEASRMGRAKDMGHTVDAYHGTGADIAEFDPSKMNPSMKLGKGFYFSGTPSYANLASSIRHKRARAKGDESQSANVMPVKLKLENPMVFDSENVLPVGGRLDMDTLKAMGHDGVILKSNKGNEITVFEPHQIRSRFAKFDPKKSKSGNILAGAGAGFLASQLLAQELLGK